MSEIPAAAVEAAADAVAERCLYRGCSSGTHRLDAETALVAAAPLIRQDERQAITDEIAAALDDEAGRAGGPIFTRALEHAAEIARRVGGGGGGGQ